MSRPQRSCVGCRAKGDPASMVRFVLDAGDGEVATVRWDPLGHHPGRGAHLHPDPRCWEQAVRGGFARSFRRRVRVVPPEAQWSCPVER